MKYKTYFEIEKITLTPGAKDLLIRENQTTSDLLLLIERHKLNDSDLKDTEDRKQNYINFNNRGMFLSIFSHLSEKLYIISYFEPYTKEPTETTILLAREY